MIAGEMGRSVWKYPKEYMKLVSKYRGALARGKQGTNVKVGLALHWNKVCGNCFDVPNAGTAAQFNASYAKVSALPAQFLHTTQSACEHPMLWHQAALVSVTPRGHEPKPLCGIDFEVAATCLKVDCCCLSTCCCLQQAFNDNKASIKQQYNLHSLRRLFEVVDVLGLSHYAPMPLQMTFASFEVRDALRQFWQTGAHYYCCIHTP